MNILTNSPQITNETGSARPLRNKPQATERWQLSNRSQETPSSQQGKQPRRLRLDKDMRVTGPLHKFTGSALTAVAGAHINSDDLAFIGKSEPGNHLLNQPGKHFRPRGSKPTKTPHYAFLSYICRPQTRVDACAPLDVHASGQEAHNSSTPKRDAYE